MASGVLGWAEYGEHDLLFVFGGTGAENVFLHVGKGV